MKLFRVSLQTKILVLVLSLVLMVIVVLSIVFGFMESNQIEEQKGKLALEVSKTVSFMPSIRHAFTSPDPSEIIQPIAERVRKEVGAEYVVVGNKQGVRYSHPVPSRIGKHMVGGDNYRALVLGEYYTSKATGSLGPSLRGKSPIFDDQGKVIGIVSVGILIKDIHQQIFMNDLKVALISFFVLIIAAIGGLLLARNIRKDTMGLEPYQIATLYKERNAVIQSIKEGILVVDEFGTITIMNQNARKLLNFHGDFNFMKVEKLLPNTKMYEVLQSGVSQQNEEMTVGNKMLITSRTPIIDNGRVVGAVSSFRDKTEIEQMVNTLSEVRKYSEDLRAQTHEFTNKLYVLSGLLQLGKYEEAISMIQSESADVEFQNRILFDQIKDAKVQAILLGKLGKASEKKVYFYIDQNTSLQELPKHVELSHLITILGNLIDNALEAVAGHKNPEVSFFATDMGNDMIFEISDNGSGVSEGNFANVFQRGFSTKEGISGEQRGYGLANVKEAVDALYGQIELQSVPGKNTIFTVYLPKEKGGGGKWKK